MTITIHDQINWLESQLKHMAKTLPIGVAQGNIDREHAAFKLSCAQASLQTLTQLRGIVRGTEATHV